jgi:hypothetical protein
MFVTNGADKLGAVGMPVTRTVEIVVLQNCSRRL